MGDRAQKLVRVPFLLERISLGIRPAVHGNFRRGDFGRLALALGSFHFAIDTDATTGDEFLNLGFVVLKLTIGNDLDVPLAGAVVELDKREATLGVAPRAHPTS